MAWARVQRPPQSPFHPGADGDLFALGLLADLSDQRNRQLDREDRLGFWNRHRPRSALGQLQIAIGLATGDGMLGHEPA
ncbi:MAG: hypothetical protein Q7N50_13085 [Armatimonadota bacterium]|nr:hypothetical protein [Armatimonadota bacterium]